MAEEDSTKMPDEPNSITTMKRFYGDRMALLSGEDLEAEMIGGNDRSCIITVASLADSVLEHVVFLNLPGLKGATQQEFEYAFRFEGPLGMFSARIEMAKYLGILDNRICEQLHDLRAMRNAVAHTKRRVTFEDKQLQNVAKRLFSPRGLFKLLDESAEGYRRTFIAEGNLLYNMILEGREEGMRLAREVFIQGGRKAPF